MEDDVRNPRRGSVDTPRLPPTAIGNIFKLLLEIIRMIFFSKEKVHDGGGNLKKRREAIRRRISERVLFRLRKYGVQGTLLQFGELEVIDDRGEPVLDDEGNKIKKHYFYAGKEVLKKCTKVFYEELPEQKWMLYDVVITEIVK